MPTIYISRPPHQDALDHCVNEWDFNRTPSAGEYDPLYLMLKAEDEACASAMREQQMAWKHVTSGNSGDRNDQ